MVEQNYLWGKKKNHSQPFCSSAQIPLDASPVYIYKEVLSKCLSKAFKAFYDLILIYLSDFISPIIKGLLRNLEESTHNHVTVCKINLRKRSDKFNKGPWNSLNVSMRKWARFVDREGVPDSRYISKADVINIGRI